MGIAIDNIISNEDFKTKLEELEIEIRYCKELQELFLLNSIKNIGDDLQKECNGIILEKTTNKVICMCQNKMTDIKLLDIEPIDKIEYCEDGTVIRLYNYNNIWYTATTKCINAKYSYWSSEKTFDDMFWEIFDKSECDILDKDCTYIFVLIHKENRIVVPHNENCLIYIASINNKTYNENNINIFKNCLIKSTTIIEEKKNDLQEYFNPSKRGIIIKSNNNSYQYDFSEYSNIKDVRGNVPFIRMRYLQLLNDPTKLQLLEHCYNEYYMLFKMIKHSLNNLYKEVHQLYFNSHIKHSITITDKNKYYRTLKQLHGHHCKNKVIITLDEVIKKINTLDANVIKKLLDWK